MRTHVRSKRRSDLVARLFDKTLQPVSADDAMTSGLCHSPRRVVSTRTVKVVERKSGKRPTIHYLSIK